MNKKLDLMISLAAELNLTPDDLRLAANTFQKRLDQKQKETDLQQKLSREFEDLSKTVESCNNVCIASIRINTPSKKPVNNSAKKEQGADEVHADNRKTETSKLPKRSSRESISLTPGFIATKAFLDHFFDLD